MDAFHGDHPAGGISRMDVVTEMVGEIADGMTRRSGRKCPGARSSGRDLRRVRSY